MKKEILDAPIRDSFFDFLEKGETIIWEGAPRKGNFYSSFSFIILVFLIFISLFIFSISKSWFVVTLFLSLVLLPFAYANFKKIKKQNELAYAITHQRVFFRQMINDKIQINSISFEHIPKVYLNENNFDSSTGNISFLIKKPAKGKFKTYHIYNSQPHELPTFEQIDNPLTVMNLLQQQIKIANDSL